MTDDISDEWRIGDNTHHTLTALLRQSAFSRRSGYEDTGDVERLCVDPTMRQVVGKRAKRCNADPRNHMGRFETEVFTEPHYVDSMLDLSGRWLNRARDRKPVRELILDLDSSVSETYGAQEGTGYNLGNFLRRLALPHSVKHWSLTRLREKLIKIRAKVVTHARCVTLRMVEVTTPRPLFKTILRRISRLGPLAPVLT